MTDELVEEERERLVQERQGEVQRVLNKHDNLVRVIIYSAWRFLTLLQIREAFHLEKFVSLIGYDPKVRNIVSTRNTDRLGDSSSLCLSGQCGPALSTSHGASECVFCAHSRLSGRYCGPIPSLEAQRPWRR